MTRQPPGVKSMWLIEVCRTCGRLAKWPFCEHRSILPEDGLPWFEAVHVSGTWHPLKAESDHGDVS